MAKSTKNTYKPSRMGNYKPVVRMENGGNVSELNYSERSEYIEENYAPFITDAQMIFSVYDSSIQYDYKANRKEVVNKIIEEYQSLGDYSEKTLPLETIYEIQDWDLVRREIDPDTDEVIGETSLEEVSADNTYNFSYLGLVDLNWRVYHDEQYDRFFYVITPHLGGDIRGNYGEAIILEGDDKEELFYRFYEGFISGGASVYLKFTDGSEIAFDSEQDSDVFTFRVSEISEPTGIAQKYLNDFEKFDSWKGDEFLEETVDIYLMRQGIAPKMMAGGKLNDETPKAYIQILGYDEGKWMNIADYSNGEDVIDAISDYMKELNKQFGGNREEYEVADYEGFGDDLFDQYMGANEFDEIIDGYEKYQNSDFPADVITAYKNDSGSRNDSLSNVIDEMDNNFFGKYNNFSDFGYEMVEQGVYEPSDRDVYVTDTDKRILAGEEADAVVDNMSFDDLLDKAQDVKSEYEDEKSELEDKISTIQSEIDDLSELQKDSENDDEYEKMSELIEEKEIELDDTQSELDDIDSRYEDKAREEAQELFYDEIYYQLENDLSSWLEEYGYTDDLQNLSFLSVDYEQIGNEIASDYLMVDFDGEIYFFNNYKKGGRIMASKRKPKYAYYIVENSTKKLVSGYGSKAEATEQRKLLVQQYPAMRFEIYPLANLESKTNLDVYAKKDYVELSTLDKIKKVSVDAYRYGEEKVGQANLFLEKHDVKGKIKRGARNVADKTKQGANWLRNQWREADFGDGKGKAKYFADGGGVDLKVTDLKKGDRLKKKGSNIEVVVLEVGNDWRSGYDYAMIESPFGGKPSSYIDVSNFVMSDVNSKAKYFADGGIIGELYGKKDGGNKIDIYYKTSNGQHHYLNSTNSSKTIREAVEKYKKILEGDSQTSFAERKRIDALEGKYADGGGVHTMPNGEVMLNSAHYSNGGGVGEIKITKNEVQFREDEPHRVYHWYEGTLGKYVFYAQTDNSFKGGYGSDGINKGSIYKLSIRKVKENGMHESIAEYWNKWDYRTKDVKDGAIRGKIIKYLDSISDERIGSPKKYKSGGKVFYEDWEMIVVSKDAEKDGGKYHKDRFLVSASNIEEAKEIATNLWNKTWEDSDLVIIKVMSESLYKLKYLDKFADGGVSYEPMTKPVPTTKPKERTKPDKDNPYKPKGIPKPKATKM